VRPRPKWTKSSRSCQAGHERVATFAATNAAPRQRSGPVRRTNPQVSRGALGRIRTCNLLIRRSRESPPEASVHVRSRRPRRPSAGEIGHRVHRRPPAWLHLGYIAERHETEDCERASQYGAVTLRAIERLDSGGSQKGRYTSLAQADAGGHTCRTQLTM